MTKTRETFRGYECFNCGEARIIISGPIPKFCDECGKPLGVKT